MISRDKTQERMLPTPLLAFEVRENFVYPARTLRALGLLQADGAPDFQQNVKMAVSPLFRPGPDPLSKTKTKTKTMTKTKTKTPIE